MTPTFVSWARDVLGNNAVVYTWNGLGLGSVGDPISGPSYADRSFQAVGTFGGAVLIIEASNDGANYFTVVDPFDNPIQFTNGNILQVTQIAAYVRPRVNGGDGTTNLVVTAVVANHQPSFS